MLSCLSKNSPSGVISKSGRNSEGKAYLNDWSLQESLEAIEKLKPSIHRCTIVKCQADNRAEPTL